MSWNYRLCKKQSFYDSVMIDPETAQETRTKVPYTEYSINEVYYNNAGEIVATVPDALELRRDSIEDIKYDLERALKAFNDEVIDLDTLKYAQWDRLDEISEGDRVTLQQLQEELKAERGDLPHGI